MTELEQLRREVAALNAQLTRDREYCHCGVCGPTVRHDSCCAVHSQPAEPNEPCNCRVRESVELSDRLYGRT